ncbi:uncharacterized protein LOC109704565 isoform X1 [Ananas comosus]|uniref:Uncharacterized protein LOC109704565 isoform X1 n=1 Tax=Ananas comosus TaxID=4615 RepID=A0A6P5EC19_ANACO|nr:uncharacterized protein LOC109704565 isoform X1 [Ananas comosus]
MRASKGDKYLEGSVREAAKMAAALSLGGAAATRSRLRPPPRIVRSWRRRRSESIRANRIAATLLPRDESDPLLRSALAAASIRHRESLRPDPLFIDPYAGCLLSLDVNHCDMEEYAISITGSSPSYYRIATKYIDDKLLNFVSRSDDLRQIVLLTDGMDTRPLRMNWPRSSILYDVSPERIFKVASQRFKGVGAKVSRGCLLIHILVESSNLLESFYRNGFNGGRPSIWALQGLPLSTLASLNDLLLVISSLAMKGSIFLGELPACLEGNKFEDKV